MSMNLIQLQQGLSMAEFMEQYGTEAKCRRALYRARWPQGFRCPACNDRRRSSFRREGQRYYQCRVCQHPYTLATLNGGTDYGQMNLSFAAPTGYEVKVSLSADAIIVRLYSTADKIFPDGFE